LVISYAITVCNEQVEIQNLVTFLLDNKREQDEIVITFDSKNGSNDVEEYLRAKSVNGEFKWYPFEFNGNFSDLKNHTKDNCLGDYICHLDADEIPHETLVEQLPQILEMNEVDLVWLPRVNTVEGITDEHIKKWGWRLNEDGWVNWPDYQWRIWKNIKSIKWKNKVHEVLEGHKTFASLPPVEEYALYHPKSIDKQEKQNKYYETL